MTEVLGSVLVVDDVRANREVIQRRLKRRGYVVTQAPDGLQALELVSQERFDLVLLDIMMPELDGIEVLQRIRKTHTRAQLPVIMVTAKDESSDVVDALKLGANDYVTKPLDMEVLLARVGTHVILKRTADSLEQANRQLEKANWQLHEDLNAAARVQQAQLPAPSPRFEGCSFAWRYEPCEQLAGDNLNVFALNDEHVGFFVLDVSGHGVRAALLSTAVNHLLGPSKEDTSVVNRPNRRREGPGEPSFLVTPPAQVAEKLNRQFDFDPTTGQFFTILYGVINTTTGECRYVSAGHPNPIFLPADGEPNFLECSGTPIGIFASDHQGYQKYEEQVLQLKSGDRLYVYSDGVPEAMNGQEQPFGSENMANVLALAREEPLDASLNQLLHALGNWANGTTFHDDLTLLGLEWRP